MNNGICVENPDAIPIDDWGKWDNNGNCRMLTPEQIEQIKSGKYKCPNDYSWFMNVNKTITDPQVQCCH